MCFIALLICSSRMVCLNTYGQENGPEFTTRAVRKWLKDLGVHTLFIEPGSPWENGYMESFNGKLKDEKLNGKIFYTLMEVQVLIERWRVEYNMFRPHSSLNYKPPAPETIQPLSAGWLRVPEAYTSGSYEA